MEILSVTRFKSQTGPKTAPKPLLSVSKAGRLSFNREAMGTMNVDLSFAHIAILFAVDGKELIARQTDMASADAFLFRKKMKKVEGKEVVSELVASNFRFKDFLVAKFDLALKPGQKNTVRLDVAVYKDGFVKIS